MRFIRVNEIPESKRCRSHYVYSLKDKIDRFLRMDIPVAKVEYNSGEYTSVNACLNSLQTFCVRNKVPAYVMMRNGEIYIIRTDKNVGGNANA